MKARLTRKNIEEYVPKTLFKGKCENYQLLHVMSEIEELERLAEIGRAFEKALKEKYGFINFIRYAGAVPEKWEMKESEYNDVLNWAKASSKNKAI